jgi:hypothetical protein
MQACPVERPDLAGHGPALRPDMPVEEQVRQAAAAARRRRSRLVAGFAALVAVAALYAVRDDAAPAQTSAPPVIQSPAAAVPVSSPPAQVVDVAVGNDTLHALLGSCTGPEQGRYCAYRLMAQTRGGPWTSVPLPLPPPDIRTGFAARLMLTGGDTLTVVDESRGRAYVSEGRGPFAVRRIGDGPPLSTGMPAGLVPELVAGRVAVLDPATGLRRPLAAQPGPGAPRHVAAGPLGDLWAVAEPGSRVVVAHSADGGRSWRTAAVPGLRPGLDRLWLVPAQDGGVYLLAGRTSPSTGGVALDGLWQHPGAGQGWSRVGGGPRPRSVGSVTPGRSGLVMTEDTGALWRLSPGGSFERLPDPQVAGTPVRAGPLASGPSGRVVSRPPGGVAGALLLVSADDGDSWLPTLVPS